MLLEYKTRYLYTIYTISYYFSAPLVPEIPTLSVSVRTSLCTPLTAGALLSALGTMMEKLKVNLQSKITFSYFLKKKYLKTADADGCLWECPEGQHLDMNFNCADNDGDFVCGVYHSYKFCFLFLLNIYFLKNAGRIQH